MPMAAAESVTVLSAIVRVTGGVGTESGVSSLQAAKTLKTRVRRKVNVKDLPPPYNIS